VEKEPNLATLKQVIELRWTPAHDFSLLDERRASQIVLLEDNHGIYEVIDSYLVARDSDLSLSRYGAAELEEEKLAHKKSLYSAVSKAIIRCASPGVVFDGPALDLAAKFGERLLNRESYRLRPTSRRSKPWHDAMHRISAETNWYNRESIEQAVTSVDKCLDTHWIADDLWLADPYEDVRAWVSNHLPPIYPSDFLDKLYW